MARKGIKQIKIPIRPNEVTIEAITPYLSYIYKKFVENSQKIKADYDKYSLDHPILLKTRAYDDTNINNIVLIPNLRSAVDWKTGYEFGNPIKYAQNKSRNTDDIFYLNKYVRNSCKRTVDKEVGTWVFSTGVGYYFIEPKSYNFDIETEAPFELYCRDADTCTKVYSSYGGNKAIFDMLYTTYEKIDKNGIITTYNVLDIYLPNTLYTFETEFGDRFELTRQEPRGLFKGLPLVEKRLNKDGIGIVATAEKMQDALDTLLSCGLDNIEETLNEIFVYTNVSLGDTPEEELATHIAMKKGGMVVLKECNKDFPPSVSTIAPKLTLAEIREFISLINNLFHSVIGVPMEMSDTNSGGTTKQGSEVANGYDNAYNRALDDINTFIKADTELLEKIMWICKNVPGNKLNNIAPSEIEIMYSLNLTDNIQTKAQAYSLLAPFLPPDMILRIVRMSNDPETDGRAIEKYMEEKSKKEFELNRQSIQATKGESPIENSERTLNTNDREVEQNAKISL